MAAGLGELRAESTVLGHWKKYVEGCEAAGREPTGKDWTVARNILIGESDLQAEDWLLDPKGSNFYYFDYLWEVLKRQITRSWPSPI